MYIIPIL